jgi:hypothetical protein
MYRRALAIREKTRGTGHPDVTNAVTNLGVLYKTMGKEDEAERLFERARGINANK